MTRELLTEQARTMPGLREMSPPIRLHYETIERRKRRRQRMWGGDLSVLTADTAGLPTIARRALAFEKVMLEMPIAVEPYDLITGSCSADDTVIRCAMPIFLRADELGRCTLQLSHKCPDYETLLTRGLRAIIDELAGRRAETARIKYDEERDQKLNFIDACIKESESVIKMAHRYADLAVCMAESAEAGSPDRERYARIAAVCRRVPEYPAAGFQEALQSIWFLNYAFFEVYTNISIGTIDRLTAPYLRADYEAGKLTAAQAQELVDSFVLHVNDRAQTDPNMYCIKDQKALPGSPRQCGIGYGYGFVTSIENDQSDAINHWGQNILIGGLLPDGGDATNAATYLFLNAHEKFSMTAPVLSARLHASSPEDYVKRVAEVLKTGGGMPYINNDDIIVSAYEALGVPREDACRYANSNCWETLIQGMSNQEMIRGMNFLYFLELALNSGRPFLPGGRRRPPDRDDQTTFPSGTCIGFSVADGVDTKDPAVFATFADLIDAWKLQLDYFVKTTMEHCHKTLFESGSHRELSSNPMLSVLTRDCVENLTDILQLGARYNLWHVMAEAVSNAADAAAAIKKFVYDEKKLTLPELVELLKNDWATERGEAFRRDFSDRAPKFGNNLDEVDGLAAEMVSYFVSRVGHHAKKLPGVIFSPCIGTYSWIIGIGKKIGASADGRHAREPIASNMSPVPGRDVSGVTSAIKSYWKLNTAPMAAGAPIDLRLNGRGLEGDAGTARVMGLIKAFLQQGGNMMTLTVTSVEDLRNAIAEPDKYRGLRVRMGGWSAYFTLLSKAAQEIHLKRAEHGV